MSCARVAVLAGGTSPEHDVSLETAKAILAHLPPDRYEGFCVEIGRDGRWAVAGADPTRPETAVARLRELGVEVVFPGLHGRYGEDGTVQGFLEVVGLPCVGSGVAASALALDKARCGEVLAAWRIPMPVSTEVRAADSATDRAEWVAPLGLPAVVKDPTGGSSLDLFVVHTEEERDAAIARLLDRPGGRALVEQYVPGRELTVPVLGNGSLGGPLRVLPAILIRPRRAAFFDYETKYDPEAVDEICPAPVEPEIVKFASSLARRAHAVLRCDGLTRTDFIVPEDGIPRFLEINTLPGLTPASLCPKAAVAAGMTFGDLLGELIELALQRSSSGP